MKKAVVYSKEYCPYCVQAKNQLKAWGVPTEEIDLTHKPDELLELVQKTGHRTVPQIFIDDIFIGGYTDMMDKKAKGEI